MKTEKEKLEDEDIQLLRTGISDNANLLSEDELDEIFGGYSCQKYISCYSNYNICRLGY